MINELIVEISLLILSFLVGYFLQRFFSKLKQEEEEENSLSEIANDGWNEITWELILDELLEKIKDVRMGKRDAKDVYKDIEQFKECLSVTMFTDVKGEVLHFNDRLQHSNWTGESWKVTIRGCDTTDYKHEVCLKLMNLESDHCYKLTLKEVKEKIIKI